MFVVDEGQFPLVIARFDAALTPDAAQQLFNRFDVLLAKAQPFALVMDSRHEGQHAKGVAKMQKDWLQAQRAQLGQYCVGIAIVTQSSRYVAFYKPIADRMIRRMYNCPGRLFTDADAAQVWLWKLLRQVHDGGASDHHSDLHD